MKHYTELVIEGNFLGYYDDDGHFITCEEFDLTDADTGKYDVQVINGDGYYNEEGRFVRYVVNDD